MAKNYRQPRRLNSVTVIMLLMFLAGGYWMWVFFPVYWDAWTVDHQLREGASALYQLNLLNEPERSDRMRKLLQKVQADCVRLAHITDPEFDVVLDMEGDNVMMRADYTVKLRHPVGNFTTVLHMKRSEKANVKRVSWD
jgi:hypothetical protein